LCLNRIINYKIALAKSSIFHGNLHFAKEIKQETQSLLTALSQSLTSQQWATASQQCDKLRFTRKLSEEIERVEERLFEL